GGALRDVQLVWKQAHASAKKGAEAVGLANRQQAAYVIADQDISRVVCGYVTESRGARAQRLGTGIARLGSDLDQRIRRGRHRQRRAGARKVDDERAAFDGHDAPDAQLRIEAMREVI